MTIGETPLAQETVPGLSAVQINKLTADQIIEEVRAGWQHDIDTGNGSVIHHEAEIGYLETEGWRVSNLVEAYRIEEPIDTAFVYDVIDFLKASDIDKEAHDGIATREAEANFIDDALGSLHWRTQKQQQQAA